MTAILTRTSALAIKVETTEGAPVSPTAASDYIAIQDDLSVEPAFDVLENAELKASLGSSKSILGFENPSASFSHYIRHSGVEGTAPNYKQLLKTVFGGEDVEATQYNTVAGSTNAVVNVDAGEGATFIRGQGLLIKDATNGYSIRPVESISVDALTLGFQVAVAPGTAVDLGKAVTYYPTNSGHQTLTLWNYVGNGGATQMVAGARVTEFSAAFEAGQLINGSYSLEGIGYYFDPIEIAAADRYIDFTDDSGTFAAIVPVKFYKDPHQLADAIALAMNDTASAQTYTVTYSNVTGKYLIKATGTVLSLLWNTGANTANTIGDKIGYSTASNDTGAAATVGYFSDTALSFASPQTPSFDNSDPLVAKYNEVFIGDADDTLCFCASVVNLTISDTKTNIDCICSESGRSGSLITGREVTITASALLEKYDAEKFKRFRSNEDTKFLYNFGSRTGANWNAGKSGCLYVPKATITAFSVVDADGLVQMDLELKAFVDSSGNNEVYLSFV